MMYKKKYTIVIIYHMGFVNLLSKIKYNPIKHVIITYMKEHSAGVIPNIKEIKVLRFEIKMSRNDFKDCSCYRILNSI